MADVFRDVGDFHEKFGLPSVRDNNRIDPPIPPHILDPETQNFRVNFLQEELDEFKQAYEEKDLAKMADALVDLVYVALGTAHMMHIPFYHCWFEVQRANMAKERANSSADERSKRKNSLDVVKPAGWKAPDIAAVLKEYGA